MFEYILNGQPYQINTEVSLVDLLAQHNFEITDVAIAINGEFLPRSSYQDVSIKNNDQVEVLEPMQGG